MPRWNERYDVTVYQLGWRLGGKTATGRGPNLRIEEHGLHVLMGWYNNTFAMLEEVYKERRAKGLAPRSPFQDWRQGFIADNATLLIEYWRMRQEMYHWTAFFPENGATPGEHRHPTEQPSAPLRRRTAACRDPPC